MSDEEFFDIVDSHPMTDEEAKERLKKIVYSNLPHYEEYKQAKAGLLSGSPDWLEDYANYGNAWSNFVLKRVSDGPGLELKSFTAESRKELIELEKQFESLGSYWIGG